MENQDGHGNDEEGVKDTNTKGIHREQIHIRGDDTGNP